MICGGCGYENPADSALCEGCGGKLESPCPSFFATKAIGELLDTVAMLQDQAMRDRVFPMLLLATRTCGLHQR